MRHAEDPTPIVCHGSWPGVITRRAAGNGGFGYDPIFFVPSEGKTAAELTREEKARFPIVDKRSSCCWMRYAMAKLPPLSLYIHIPRVYKMSILRLQFHALKGEVPHDDYVQHLLNDLDADVARAQGREVKTIFIGGGTPSLLSGRRCKRCWTACVRA